MAPTRPKATAVSRKAKGKTNAVDTAEKEQEKMQATESVEKDNGLDKVVVMSDKSKGKQKAVDVPQVDEDVVMSDDVVVMSEAVTIIARIPEKLAGKQKATNATQKDNNNDNDEAMKKYHGENIQEKSKESSKNQVAPAPGMGSLSDAHPEGSVMWALSLKNEAALAKILADYSKSGNPPGKHIDPSQEQEVLRHAIEKGTNNQIKMILVKLKVNLNGTRSVKGSALAEAAKKGDSELVTIILKLGCSVKNGYDRGGGDAVHAAAAAGQSKPLELLLCAGAPTNVKGGEFGYPLQAAMCSGRPFSDVMCVSLLLQDDQEDVNARGGKYGTALLAAVARGRPILLSMVVNTRRVDGGVIDEALKAAKEALKAAKVDAATSSKEQEDKENIHKKMVEILENAARAVKANKSAQHLVDVDKDDVRASNGAAIPKSTDKDDWNDTDELTDEEDYDYHFPES